MKSLWYSAKGFILLKIKYSTVIWFLQYFEGWKGKSGENPAQQPLLYLTTAAILCHWASLCLRRHCRGNEVTWS